MRYAFIEKHRSAFGVERMCRALKVSRSGYYGWRKRGESKRCRANRELLELIIRIIQMSRWTYGSPRITAELGGFGIKCSKNRVAKIMRENGIRAKTKRRFKATTKSRHNFPVAKNVLARQFSAIAPNRKWTSDITYIWTHEGWLYLAVILDIYSRKVVGWSMSGHLTKKLTIDALNQAVSRREPTRGLIFHTDRGSRFACGEFQNLLTKYGMIPSMSRTGDCYDNAITETFFGTLKTELIYFEKYRSRNEARRSIFEYIEVFYNCQRRHSALGYMTPAEFEKTRLN